MVDHWTQIWQDAQKAQAKETELHVWGYGVLTRGSLEKRVIEYLENALSAAKKGHWRHAHYFIMGNGCLPAFSKTIIQHEDLLDIESSRLMLL